MAKKMSSKTKAPEPVRIHVGVLAPPSWLGREDALEHLAGEFTARLYAAQDSVYLGANPDLVGAMLFDLAQTAQAIATSIREDRPLEVDDETSTNLPELVALAERVREKAYKNGFEFETASGLGCDLDRATLPVLSSAIAHAALMLGVEGARRWTEEQRSRRDGIGLLVQSERIKRKEQALELRSRGMTAQDRAGAAIEEA